MWLDTQDARGRDRNPSNFTLDCVSDHSATKQTTLAKRNLRYFNFRNSSSSLCLHFFYKLSATRVLNSFEELCITLAAAGNSFARELNPHGGAYIYIYIHCFIYIYIYIYLSVYMHLSIYLSTTHTHTQAQTYTHTHIYSINVSIYLSIYQTLLSYQYFSVYLAQSYFIPWYT